MDYMKEYNGIEVKGQYPFYKQFEFPMDFANEAVCKKIMDKLFKVKKNVTQITFEGELIEGGAVVTATMDDVPDDIKELIELGIYTEEEALARCSSNGNREQRMLLRKPMVKLEGDDKTPVLQVFTDKYKEDELVLDYLYQNQDDSDDEDVEDDNTESTDVDNSMDWLNNL